MWQREEILIKIGRFEKDGDAYEIPFDYEEKENERIQILPRRSAKNPFGILMRERQARAAERQIHKLKFIILVDKDYLNEKGATFVSLEIRRKINEELKKAGRAPWQVDDSLSHLTDILMAAREVAE